MFTYHNDVNTKSELVIFLRPTIIHDASLTGDFAKAGVVVPGDDFFVNDKAGASRPAPAKKTPGKEADAP
jgi:general secretion pathway protein D